MEFYLLIGCIVFSIVFAWFFSGILNLFSIPLVRWGSVIHTTLKRRELQEKDAWLFTLLVSVTRSVVIILAGFAFLFTLLSVSSDSEVIKSVESVVVNTFWIIFIMREGAIFLGGVLFGELMSGVIRSLKS